MTNNVFTFGDTIWKQTSNSTAIMGTPPAPPYATIYYTIHEATLTEEFGDNLLIYKCFIDDIIGIWTVMDPATDSINFNAFKTQMKDYYGLDWEVSNQCTQIDFMDLTLMITNNRIHTALYAKMLNLYLYKPLHYAHPPGVLYGIVVGAL
jgi:hypothetical protein